MNFLGMLSEISPFIGEDYIHWIILGWLGVYLIFLFLCPGRFIRIKRTGWCFFAAGIGASIYFLVDVLCVLFVITSLAVAFVVLLYYFLTQEKSAIRYISGDITEKETKKQEKETIKETKPVVIKENEPVFAKEKEPVVIKENLIVTKEKDVIKTENCSAMGSN